MIPVPANTVEYLRFFGEANMFRSPMGNAMFKNGDHVVVDHAPFHHGAASPVLGNWLGRQGKEQDLFTHRATVPNLMQPNLYSTI